MPFSFSIRPATADDASSIGRLAGQFSRYLRRLGDTTEFKLDAAALRRDGFGAQPTFAGLVAEDGGKVIGYLLFHFGYDSDRARRNLHIVDLYVHSSARRRGVGLALMKAAAGVARKADAHELIWSVYHANTAAAAFYASLGAQRVTDVFFMKLQSDRL